MTTFDRSLPSPGMPGAVDRLKAASVALAELEQLMRGHASLPPGFWRLVAHLHDVLGAPPPTARDAALKTAAAQRHWPDAPPWLEEQPLSPKQRRRKRDAGK